MRFCNLASTLRLKRYDKECHLASAGRILQFLGKGAMQSAAAGVCNCGGLQGDRGLPTTHTPAVRQLELDHNHASSRHPHHVYLVCVSQGVGQRAMLVRGGIHAAWYTMSVTTFLLAEGRTQPYRLRTDQHSSTRIPACSHVEPDQAKVAVAIAHGGLQRRGLQEESFLERLEVIADTGLSQFQGLLPCGVEPQGAQCLTNFSAVRTAKENPPCNTTTAQKILHMHL
eukprot:scaffold176575_cov21-Tisochrysis_lutea.AAC.1